MTISEAVYACALGCVVARAPVTELRSSLSLVPAFPVTERTGAADLHVLLPLQDGGGDGDLVIRLRQAALHQAGAARERRYVQDQEVALLSRAPAPGQDPSLDIGTHRCDPVSRGDLLHGPLGDPASGGVVLVVRQDHHVGVTDTGAGALGDPGPNGVGDDEDEDDEGRAHGHRHEGGSTAA